MPDPRDIERRSGGPRQPANDDPYGMRRFGPRGEPSSGMMWGWVATVFAIIVIIALIIGYDRSNTVARNQASSQPSAPATTGAAPPAAPASTTPPSTPALQANPAPGANPPAPENNPGNGPQVPAPAASESAPAPH